MSSTKNFGVDGIGSNVQFGKGGSRIANDSGSLKVLNPSGAALATLRVASPVADEDAITFLLHKNDLGTIKTNVGLDGNGHYVANTFSSYIASATSFKTADDALDGALAALQIEVNSIETGTGLNANGTLTVPGSTYLANSTSLLNAITKLDTALNTVQGELNVTQTGVGLSTSGTYVVPTGTNYLSGSTTLASATILLDTAIFAVQGELNVVETAVGLGGDGTLPAWTTPNYISGSTSLIQAISSLDDQLKSTNDTLTSMGSALSYRGTVAGGAAEISAFDLDTLSETTGSYYKVSQSGHFSYDGGDTFFANVNDGIVKNMDGGWDIIDNTNAAVFGSSNRIAVTGSLDDGFTVDISSSYVGQSSITTLGTITNGVWNGTAISAVRGGTGQTVYAVGDILVATSTTALEKLPRGSAKQQLRINSAGETLEYADLIAADVAFSDGSYTATNASTALIEVRTKVNAVQTGAGLTSAGDFVANTSTTYIAAATSLKQSDNLLDVAISTLATTVGNMTEAEIFSPNTFYSVKTTNTQTEFYGNVNAAKVLVGKVVSGNNTNTRFSIDMATAGRAKLAVESGTLSNADLALVPLGTGSIDASGARMTNLANATQNADAVSFGFAKSTMTSYKTVAFTEANAPVSLGTLNGLVKRVIVQINDAFAAPSGVTVGTSGNTSLLVTGADIDHSEEGIYIVDVIASVNAVVSVYISGSGAGTGTVIVEYLASQ
jgi:hypothetical protein